MITGSVANATCVWRFLRWETGCIAFDMTGATAGLFVGLSLGNWAAAAVLLWAVSCVSITARTFRYGGILD